MAELATAPDGKDMLVVDDAADLERWLAAEHARPTGVWLVRARPGSDVAPLDYEDMIAVLLCYGWIDAVIKVLDDQRSLLWISPRRRGSVWSRPNKERIERLEASGRLRPPGRAVIDRAKADGSWTVLDGAEKLEVPDDLAAALDATGQARANFDAYPPSVRKGFLGSIAMAKTSATRARRIEATVRMAAANERP
jgi:uncharacterized protein YdeI (YjbR/CyaY-like superfamily)